MGSLAGETKLRMPTAEPYGLLNGEGHRPEVSVGSPRSGLNRDLHCHSTPSTTSSSAASAATPIAGAKAG